MVYVNSGVFGGRFVFFYGFRVLVIEVSRIGIMFIGLGEFFW